MENKIKKLKTKLLQNKLDAFFISNPANIFYLTGFKGVSETERESFAVYKDSKLFLIAPKLYQQQTLSLPTEFLKIVIAPERDKLLVSVMNLLSVRNVKSIGFEVENLRFNEFRDLSSGLKNKKLKAMNLFISEPRSQKTEEEIKCIKTAQEIAVEAFKKLLKFIKAGVTEKQLAEKLKNLMIENSTEAESFGAVVAFGKNSALPHYETGNVKLKKDQMILFDFGAKYKGYCGDITRMVFFGKPTTRMQKIYDLVRQSHDKGIAMVKSGVIADKVFQASNNVFVEQNLADKFIHGLGHGVGTEIHEEPYIRNGSQTILQEGMVFSIEPGLYFPGWGGVRLEDLVICCKNSAEILGNSSLEMIVIKPKS